MKSQSVEETDVNVASSEGRGGQGLDYDSSGPTRQVLEARLLSFKNLIVVINGHCEQLLNGESLSTSQVESLKEIYVAGARAENLARHFFDREAPAISSAVLTDPADVVSQCEEALSILAGDKVQVFLKNEIGSTQVRIEKTIIEQALFILTNHARESMPLGGNITLTVSKKLPDPQAQKSSSGGVGGGCLCIVSSNKPLPRPNHGNKEPAVVPPSIAEETNAMDGLQELNIIAGRIGGSLQAEVGPDQEKWITFIAPLGLEADSEPSWARDKETLRSGKESILLVEDEQSVRLLTVSFLQKCGYRVLSAASAGEALEVWKRHDGRPELLLTDLVLPGSISGHGLADTLKQQKPGLKVIYTSGNSAETSRQLFKMEPGFAFLQKPFRPVKLAELVRRVLDGEASGT